MRAVRTQTLPFGKPLAEAITRKSGRVFQKVVTEGTRQSLSPIDGYEDVSVGMTTLDLYHPRQSDEELSGNAGDRTWILPTRRRTARCSSARSSKAWGSGDVEVNEVLLRGERSRENRQEAIRKSPTGWRRH